MASVNLILFFLFGAISFILADNAVNLTGWYDDQWEALEALRKRYPFAELHLSVEVEQNTIFPPAANPTIPTTTTSDSRKNEIEKTQEEVPKSPTRPPKIATKAKKIIKKAKN
uniref:Uncharacterized protein n=1 Tax=Panagrolaimus sp. ES5 TaxID=591445 RepID=A0AC34FG65_9BILA